VRLGVYLQEHHAAWPWPEARWQWVDRAMAEHTEQRWFTTAAGLAQALAGAAHVRCVADPHISPWLPALARLGAAPALFPPVQRHCTSFSQWWTRSTRGLQHAQELL
jgi:deoxyribodipyrimidine photo-lyase